MRDNLKNSFEAEAGAKSSFRDFALKAYESIDGDKKENIAVFMQGVSSEEQLRDPRSGELSPLFRNVNLTVSAREIWGISSNELNSARLLTQVIGNMRGYSEGLCQLGPMGTITKKRRITPHIFYIDTHEMLYPGKTVLEQLVFATAAALRFFADAERQAKMLRLLENVGMGYIALSSISDLYDTEKILLELLIASESGSRLIVCDFTAYTFSQAEIAIMANIANRIRYLGKTAVIAAMQPKLIGMVCDNTLFICRGEPIFCGSVEELNKYADKVAFILRDSNPQVLARMLSCLLPGWRIKVSGENLYLYNYTDKQLKIEDFYSLLAENRLTPESVRVNPGRVENSFEELMERYDIQRKTV